jgi:hypothetical protein
LAQASRTKNSLGPDSFTVATAALIRTRTSGSVAGISLEVIAPPPPTPPTGIGDWHDHSPHPAARAATATPAAALILGRERARPTSRPSFSMTLRPIGSS